MEIVKKIDNKKIDVNPKIVELEKENAKLRSHIIELHNFQNRMHHALARAIEMIMPRLAPFANPNHWMSSKEKTVLLGYLAKQLAPIAHALSGDNQTTFQKQIAILVKQTHQSFLKNLDVFEPDLKVTFNGNQFIIKERKEGPHVLQISGEKGPLHKASLAEFIKAIKESEE